jgi:hypothetical protein
LLYSVVFCFEFIAEIIYTLTTPSLTVVEVFPFFDYIQGRILFRNSPPCWGRNSRGGEREREGEEGKGKEGKGKRGREGKLPKIGHWLSKNWGRKSSAKKGRGE